MNKSDRVRRLLAKGLSAAEIAKRLKIKASFVHTLKWLDKKNKKPEKKAQFKSPRSRLVNDLFEMKKAMDAVEQKPKPGLWDLISADDPVNHPPHYKSGGIETIDFIEAKDLNYRLGNVVKYVSRAGKKGDPIQDLEKALWYLQREINARKNA